MYRVLFMVNESWVFLVIMLNIYVLREDEDENFFWFCWDFIIIIIVWCDCNVLS